MKMFLAFVVAFAGLFLLVSSGHCTVPDQITTLQTDATTVRSNVWDFVAGSVAFGVLIAWIAKVRGKRG